MNDVTSYDKDDVGRGKATTVGKVNELGRPPGA